MSLGLIVLHIFYEYFCFEMFFPKISTQNVFLNFFPKLFFQIVFSNYAPITFVNWNNILLLLLSKCLEINLSFFSCFYKQIISYFIKVYLDRFQSSQKLVFSIFIESVILKTKISKKIDK